MGRPKKVNNEGGFSSGMKEETKSNIMYGGYNSSNIKKSNENVTNVDYEILKELQEIKKAIQALHKNIIE